MYYRVFTIFFNKKVWNSFPPNIQNAIMGVSGRDASVTYSVANVNAGTGRKMPSPVLIKPPGNLHIYTLDHAQLSAWQAAVIPVWDKWVADLQAKKLPGAEISPMSRWQTDSILN